jgi:hypothetical protein
MFAFFDGKTVPELDVLYDSVEIVGTSMDLLLKFCIWNPTVAPLVVIVVVLIIIMEVGDLFARLGPTVALRTRGIKDVVAVAGFKATWW